MHDIFEELRKTRDWFDNLTGKKLKDIEIIRRKVDLFYRDWRDSGLPHAAQEVTDD